MPKLPEPEQVSFDLRTQVSRATAAFDDAANELQAVRDSLATELYKIEIEKRVLVPDSDALQIISTAIWGSNYFALSPDTAEIRSARERSQDVLNQLREAGIRLVREST